MKQVDCIIPAAGLSSRMGQWKMMLPWRMSTILDASIKNAQQFCSNIILVTGYRHEELEARYFRESGITLVHNPDYQQGLFSSVSVGVNKATADYCFISHGDLPCLHREIFESLWEQRINGVLLPQYQGTPGHPILAKRDVLQQCLQQHSGQSVRQALLAHKHKILALDYPEMIFDVDTPDDFSRLQLYQKNPRSQ
ncbi:NTP transferase domain-containing protein [Cedecea neteri]|uniref:NTP transferase domain-containing protein n=1 Tax=Cedecea neteri TaxID=158822 RepID=UPI00155E42B8|nr:NTP transferase domain-containing protein [Cedecea neteri]NIG77695.1 NTP transferase domain-containing protein [Klebsiella sp. Ap-873]WNJ81781.1 NTP transferase domain-containing protein [Cedecea neteri]